MATTVLILGGTGRIGSSVARYVCRLPDVAVTISGRNVERGQQLCQTLGEAVQFMQLTLENVEGLQEAISKTDLVIHCAGPFLYRDVNVLKLCIETVTNYLDVSDSRDFTQLALSLRTQAEAAGITAVINSGIFPGISNSMVRQAAEQLDIPETIQLSYVVAGSGGAGLTVMRTTFLGLLHPFQAWVDGTWQAVAPYSDRQSVTFPHYGKAPVYWFDVPETLTLAESFPSVRTVATKFGSLPDLYNHLTWLMDRGVPPKLLKQPATIEFLSYVSYGMTQVSDRFTGIGVAIRAEVMGRLDGSKRSSVSSLFYDDTAAAAGMGTAAIADSVLQGRLAKPGVWPVEQAVSTKEFERAMTAYCLPINLNIR
ncbi:MAG: saccharopine dehydrogenase NADP-binding domain-containing protein [Cyanobacteria bacterium P01_E01_bin.34]